MSLPSELGPALFPSPGSPSPYAHTDDPTYRPSLCSEENHKLSPDLDPIAHCTLGLNFLLYISKGSCRWPSSNILRLPVQPEAYKNSVPWKWKGLTKGGSCAPMLGSCSFLMVICKTIPCNILLGPKPCKAAPKIPATLPSETCWLIKSSLI